MEAEAIKSVSWSFATLVFRYDTLDEAALGHHKQRSGGEMYEGRMHGCRWRLLLPVSMSQMLYRRYVSCGTYLVDLGHCDGWGILMEDDGDENADVEQLAFWVARPRTGAGSAAHSSSTQLRPHSALLCLVSGWSASLELVTPSRVPESRRPHTPSQVCRDWLLWLGWGTARGYECLRLGLSNWNFWFSQNAVADRQRQTF